MNTVAQAASMLSTLIFFPLLVKAFGVGDYGVYVLAMSVAGLAQMLDFGVGAATVRRVARHASLDDTEGLNHVVSSVFGLLGLMGVLMALLVGAVAYVSGTLFSVSATQAVLLRELLLVVALSQLWYWPASASTHVLNGLARYDIVARTSVLTTIAGVGLIGFVLYVDGGPLLLLGLGIGVSIIASIANALALRRVGPWGKTWPAPSYSMARQVLSEGAPVFLTSVAFFVNREQTDRLVVGAFIGPAGVVVYEVASKLSMLISQVAALPTSAVLPVASSHSARDETSALRELFLKGSRYVALAVAPFVVILAVLAKPLILAWFGPGFASSIPVAQLLVMAQLLFPPLLIGDPILIATGRLGRWVPKALKLALLNVILSIVLVQYLGVPGVALATLVVSYLEIPLYARLMFSETHTAGRDWFRGVWPGYACLPVTAVVAVITASTGLGESLLGLAVCGGLSLTAYWLTCYAFVLTGAERTALRARIERATARNPGRD